jgi:nitrite reductase/ring-hydroxylating ferredoxin subunit
MTNGMVRMQHHDVASLKDFPDDSTRTIDVEDTAILLIRDGQTVHAIGAKC